MKPKTNKDLHFITVQPSDKVFASQIITQLSNFQDLGYSSQARVLVFIPQDRVHLGPDPLWKEAEELFPESKFFYYKDEDGSVLGDIRTAGYIPLLRPWTLWKHFTEYPILSKDVIFYLDSDVVFTRELDFLDEFKKGKEWYFSNAQSYMNAGYFDLKVNDVPEGKKNAYKAMDILGIIAGMCGTTRKEAEKHNNATGGVQYIFKDVNADFFREVYEKCKIVKPTLAYFNQQFFDHPGLTPQQREDKGIQSWCTDLFVIQFLAWSKGKVVKTPPEMNFLWATDAIIRNEGGKTYNTWDKYYIYHDAGGCDMTVDGKVHHLFNKREGKYVNNIESYYDSPIEGISTDYCSLLYVNEINKAKNKLLHYRLTKQQP